LTVKTSLCGSSCKYDRQFVNDLVTKTELVVNYTYNKTLQLPPMHLI